jgi:diguanylate cyclase (GGDEF)-like protein
MEPQAPNQEAQSAELPVINGSETSTILPDLNTYKKRINLQNIPTLLDETADAVENETIEIVDQIPSEKEMLAVRLREASIALQQPEFQQLNLDYDQFLEKLSLKVGLRFGDIKYISQHLERVYNATKEDKLISESSRDFLTGLLNRRGLRLALERFVQDPANQHLLRAEVRHSVIISDLDHFKQVNDTHGHGFGDRVLSLFGRTILSNIRGKDFAVRYGGEESLIILTDADTNIASDFDKRLRSGMETINDRNEAFLAKKHRQTYSSGIATITGAQLQRLAMCPLEVFTTELEDLMKDADSALYQAKDLGRNQTVISPPTSPTPA